MSASLRSCLIAICMMLITGLAASQANARDEMSPFALRASQLPQILDGAAPAETYFSKPFLAEVPPEQISMIARQLVVQNGKLQGIAKVKAESSNNGEVTLNYERATVVVRLVAGSEPPNLVIGLLIASVAPRNDGRAKIEADIRALPGKANLLVTRLNAREPPLLEVNASHQMAIGSTFKLWILAEAARQVKAGQRQWSSVIPLGPPSLPSGTLQNWPPRVPMTLHSLATFMISISDNTASDTLLLSLGRSRVGSMLSAVGHSNPAQTLPLLTTIEAFALKMQSAEDMRRIWQRGSQGERAQLLQSAGNRLSLSAIDRTQLGNGPRYIDSVEWFSSAQDVARTLDWLRINAGREALDIMAINRPMPQNDIGRFSYVGYKGGSEIGVISMSYLIKTRAGDWYAVTGSWNDSAAAIDNQKFEALINRAVSLIN